MKRGEPNSIGLLYYILMFLCVEKHAEMELRLRKFCFAARCVDLTAREAMQVRAPRASFDCRVPGSCIDSKAGWARNHSSRKLDRSQWIHRRPREPQVCLFVGCFSHLLTYVEVANITIKNLLRHAAGQENVRLLWIKADLEFDLDGVNSSWAS